MTVEQNILAGMDRSLPRAERRNRLEELLDRLFLTGLGRRRPAQLSGGQQQRAALGRILASEPAVLLLDEPLSALDSYLKWQVELELMEVLDQFHGPTLFVTHSRDEVYHFCQTVCVLEHGRSQSVETVEQLFSAPETLSACLLSGCKNVSRARPAGEDLVEALDWGVTLRCGRSVPEGLSHIGVRAHFLRPTAEPGPNAISCRVLRVIDNVFSTVVMLSTPGGRTGFSISGWSWTRKSGPLLGPLNSSSSRWSHRTSCCCGTPNNRFVPADTLSRIVSVWLPFPHTVR